MIVIKIDEKYFKKFNKDGELVTTETVSECAKYKTVEGAEEVAIIVRSKSNTLSQISVVG